MADPRPPKTCLPNPLCCRNSISPTGVFGESIERMSARAQPDDRHAAIQRRFEFLHRIVGQ